MLDDCARNLVANRFYVYDHDWRYLSCHVGEPSLIDDLLIYDDGAVLSLCAFDLMARDRVVSRERIDGVLAKLHDGARHRLVHIWGQFEVAASLSLNGQLFSLTDPSAATEEYPGEFTVDLQDEVLDLARRRKTLSQMEKQGLSVSIATSEPLTALELNLIEIWRNTHELAPLGVSAGQAIASFVRERSSFTTRVYLDGHLVGFGVISRPSDKICVNLMSFSRRVPGKRIDDARLLSSLDFGRELGCNFFHLGYAGSESLASFKQKWGGRETGPRYKDAIYTADHSWDRLAKSYSFAWISRLVGQGTSCQSDF